MKNLGFSIVTLLLFVFTTSITAKDFGAASPAFVPLVPLNPVVKLRPEMCGITDYTTNDIIKSTQPPGYSTPIAYYQWKFEELEAPFNVYEKVSPNPTNPNYRLFWFNEIEYGRSYNVSIRLAVNPGAVVGDYGPVCTIEMQENVLSTQLEQQYNAGYFSLCDVVGADPVQGADKYRWEFTSFLTSETFHAYGDNNQRLLRLSKVQGLKLAMPYNVKVFAQMGGMESLAGTMSFISMGNTAKNTKLRNDLYPCGGTYPLKSQVQAVEVCSAENYTWRFRNTSQTQPALIYTRTGGNRFIRLEWISGLIPGDSYNLDVKARQGGKNGDYSTVCNITIENTLSGFTDQIYAVNGGSADISIGEGFEAVEAETQIELVVLNNGGSSRDGIVFDIASADVDNITRVELYDLNGRLIAERTEHVVREGNRIDWNIPGLSPGIYLLRAVNGQDAATQKVFLF